MSTKTVYQEEPFQVPSKIFGIGGCSVQYELKWSVDKTNWTKIADVSANANYHIKDNCKAFWYKLSGNSSTSKVIVAYDE